MVQISRNSSTLITFTSFENGLINKKVLAPVFVVVEETNIKGVRILIVQMLKLAPKTPVNWVTEE